ncbi:hypothetical protein Mgra_00005667, partial [Meloidogyne graminicola]
MFLLFGCLCFMCLPAETSVFLVCIFSGLMFLCLPLRILLIFAANKYLIDVKIVINSDLLNIIFNKIIFINQQQKHTPLALLLLLLFIFNLKLQLVFQNLRKLYKLVYFVAGFKCFE